ncbi:MAG: thiolase family protein [Deltaproteobacteria bacterium]|nr:thiolase family protein [Deltaproteobacteria bacterium]
MSVKLSDIVVISAARTPMGRFGGTLKDTASFDLGATAIREAIRRSGIQASDVSEVIYGSCRQAGNGPNPSRTASVRAGIPINISTNSINMACPSGMKCVHLGTEALRLGDSEIVVAGGMDSMSTIPYLLKGARWQGFRMGPKTLEDGWTDSIDPLTGQGMGDTAENLVEKYGLKREDLDQFAVASHQKAALAQKEGRFDEEIVSVEVPAASKKQAPVQFSKDETIRYDASLEQMAKLSSSFRKGGSVTAGNSCGLSDGACAVVMTTREKAKELGAKPLFSFVSFAQAAVEPSTMGEGPGVAIPMALKKAGMTLGDIDLFEINEAFAAQVLTNVLTLNLDTSKLNLNGGAIALGHPTGISGCRILITGYHILKTTGKEILCASICGGGGVTMAAIIRREL